MDNFYASIILIFFFYLTASSIVALVYFVRLKSVMRNILSDVEGKGLIEKVENLQSKGGLSEDNSKRCHRILSLFKLVKVNMYLFVVFLAVIAFTQLT